MTKEEAIEIVKEFINGTCLHLVDQEALETLIPELRESEDERIRQEMIEFLNQYKEDGLRGVDITPWISYLEKQKEQKPSKWSEEDEKIRKALCELFKGYPLYGLRRDDVLSDIRIVDILDWLEKQKEQKPEIRVKIPKFRVGDIIQRIPLEKWDSSKKIVSIDEHGYNYNLSHLGDTVSGGAIGFAFENDYELVEQKPSEWSFPYGENETVDNLIAIAECLERDGDCLFSNEHTGTECGKFLRDLARKQVECKPAEWSEEDAKVLNDIVVFVSGYADKRVVSRWVEFLKSLRPKKNISYGELPLVSIDYMEGLDTDFEKQVGAVIASAMNREHQFTSKYIKWTAQRLMEYAKDKQNSEKESVSDNKEWSEEDEDFIIMLILHFNYLIDKGGDNVETYKNYVEKLKSLCPRLKQEQQIKVGDKVSIHCRKDRNEDVISIYEGKVGKVIHVWDAKKNPWGHIGVSLDNGCNNGFYEDELEIFVEPHWKPSEDQMEALSDTLAFMPDTFKPKCTLVTLQNDLKKQYGTAKNKH